MDSVKIDEILRAMDHSLKLRVQDMLREADNQCAKTSAEITQTLIPSNGVALGRSAFHTALKKLDSISGNVTFFLEEIGFDTQKSATWLQGEKAPPATSRSGIVELVIKSVVAKCLRDNIVHTVKEVLECGSMRQESFEELKFFPREELLLQKITDAVGYADLSERTKNCLKNQNIVTLGELASYTQASLLHMSHLGRKSFNQIKEFLQNLNLDVDCLTEAEAVAVKDRLSLERVMNKLLVTQWHGEPKPEFAELDECDLREKARQGEAVFETCEADYDLIAALAGEGISERTQLATAPMNIVKSICELEDGWEAEILLVLNGRDRSLYHDERPAQLRVGTPVPPGLNEKVRVFQEQ